MYCKAHNGQKGSEINVHQINCLEFLGCYSFSNEMNARGENTVPQKRPFNSYEIIDSMS